MIFSFCYYIYLLKQNKAKFVALNMIDVSLWLSLYLGYEHSDYQMSFKEIPNSHGEAPKSTRALSSMC